MDPNDPDVQTAVFGRQVEDFLSSEIGDYLVNKAKDEIVTAVEELKKADPYECEVVQSIQNRIAIAEKILSWLGDAIISGNQALQNLEEK